MKGRRAELKGTGGAAPTLLQVRLHPDTTRSGPAEAGHDMPIFRPRGRSALQFPTTPGIAACRQAGSCLRRSRGWRRSSRGTPVW